jgi:peroxisomal membrane protein 4
MFRYSLLRYSWRERATLIFRATKQHAFNLAKFVSLYKICLLIQKKANNGKPRNSDTFIAGLLSGYLVFGERNAVNEQVCILVFHLPTDAHDPQVVLYVVSRVVASFVPRSTSSYKTSPQSALAGSTVKPVPPDSRAFSLFAALAWGSAMWLFQNRGETIQPGMFHSMIYLYRDSETWKDLKTLLWHNN